MAPGPSGPKLPVGNRKDPPMEADMKFLSVFYAVMTLVAVAALLFALVDAHLGAMLLVVIAMFAGMGGLALAVRDGSRT